MIGGLLERARDTVDPRVERFAFLGLGSNIEDRLDHLQGAVDLLHADVRSRVDGVSSVFETDPVGGPEQGPFLNIAVRVATRRSPVHLLALCQEVEAALGRVKTVRWGPRTMDVDVLLYGDRVVRRPELQVPHPRLAERPFALVPLIEVAPGARLPAADGRPSRSLTATLAALAPVEGIRAVGRQIPEPGPHPDAPGGPG